MPEPVHSEERQGQNGQRVGVITLDEEATLNSLSLEMVRAVQAQITAWRDDKSLVAVVLRGAGDRAFCAGGDIQALYRAMVDNHAAGQIVDNYPQTFFEEEYRLDHDLHTYSKPVICLGHGIVMGGGLGLFWGSRFRIATERTRVALPEITIGLFPDAGSTWFFRNSDASVARFMGLTGCNLNGRDALDIGLATHLISSELREQVIDDLCAREWHNIEEEMAALLDSYDTLALDGNVTPRRAFIDSAFGDGATLASVGAHLADAASDDDFLARCQATFAAGCPTTAHIVLAQVARTRDADIATCFQVEMNIASHCAMYTDFAEGVRALLIDKDNAPAWQYAKFDDVPPQHVEAHFEPLWDDHPLADLG